jgi:hypothetical protein
MEESKTYLENLVKHEIVVHRLSDNLRKKKKDIARYLHTVNL